MNKTKPIRIFLGGTCAETTWRDELIELLKKYDIEWFNPVVEDWTPECQAIEEEEKNHKCNVHLYVITDAMMGTYSVAESIHSAHLANMYGTSVDLIIFAILKSDKWQKHDTKSFNADMRLIKDIAPHNSIVTWVDNMEQLCEHIVYYNKFIDPNI